MPAVAVPANRALITVTSPATDNVNFETSARSPEFGNVSPPAVVLPKVAIYHSPRVFQGKRSRRPGQPSLCRNSAVHKIANTPDREPDKSLCAADFWSQRPHRLAREVEPLGDGHRVLETILVKPC